MVEPVDGSVHTKETINVICIIEDPGSVSGISINGNEAMMMKDMATTSVTLDRGINKILTGLFRSYSSNFTYLLSTESNGSTEPSP